MRSRTHSKSHWLVLLTLTLSGILGVPNDTARADDDTLALIEELVIAGEATTETRLEQLAVRLAATGQDEPGRTGFLLAANDEIRTGPDTQAILRFLDTEAEVDPWVFLDRSSVLRIVDQRSVETLLGRLFATLKGLFTVLTPQGQLGVEGTEFEIVLADGDAVEIQVLEGAAEFRPSLPEERSNASPAQIEKPFWEVEAAPNTRQRFDKTLPLRNVCQKKHKFTLTHTESLEWLDFTLRPKTLSIPGAGRAPADLSLAVDARGIPPGVYLDTLRIECLDCHKDDDCIFEPRPLRLRVLVGVANRRIEPLQRLDLRAGDSTPGPEAMVETQARALLSWTDDVLLAGQPTYPAPGDPPSFDNREIRAHAFRANRYKAIWQQDARAQAELGKVYNDWGEGKRATVAYEDAAVREPDLNDEPEFLTRLSQAHRQAGQLDEAETRAREAVSRQSESSHAHLALANVLRNRATVAESRGDAAAATDYLDRSLLAYDDAKRWTEVSSATPNDRRGWTRGVVATNTARSRAQLAKMAAAEGEDSRAERLLREVRDETRTARSNAPQDPYSLLEDGAASQRQALIEARRGDPTASQTAFEEAERQYRQALDRHPDLAAAHYRLGTLWVDRGPRYHERAERAYERCLALRPTYGPAYYALGKLLLQDDPERAERYFDVYQKVTPDELERPLPLPNFRGRQIADAQAAIAKLGLRLTEVQRAPSPRPSGTVIGQQPEPGTDVEPEGAIKLVMAVPEGRFPMPDLRNLSEAGARHRITLLGLNLGKVDDKVKKEQTRVVVLKQTPDAGEMVQAQDTVALVFAAPPGARVPDVVGQRQRAAVKKIEKNKLSLGDITEQASCEAKGTVITQRPEKGRRVPSGSTVDLVLASPGPDARRVPKLDGLLRAQAGQLLQRASLRGEAIHREDERTEGTVLSQEPAPGTLLAPGCKVRLTLAKPIPLVEVPQLTGAALSEVQRAFAGQTGVFARLQLGRVTGAQTERVPAGTVLRQDPAAGSRVRSGQRVDLVVASRTPPPERTTGLAVPRVICLPPQRASSAISKAGFRAVLKGQGEVVRQQSPAAGSRAAAGSVVTLALGRWDDDCGRYPG
ncbi:MAG: PASTA domain-containing protein [Acidobacteriota bacterium]